MDLNEYVSPSLSILIPILYLCGMAIKKSDVSDHKIPFILSFIGIVLANIWLFAENVPTTWQDTINRLLFGTCQGIICAACSVYTNNLIKQYGEGKESKNDNDKIN